MELIFIDLCIFILEISFSKRCHNLNVECFSGIYPVKPLKDSLYLLPMIIVLYELDPDHGTPFLKDQSFLHK